MNRPYCRHRKCRTATVIDLAFLAVALQRQDVLQRAVQVRDNPKLKVRCREVPRYVGVGPLPARRFA